MIHMNDQANSFGSGNDTHTQPFEGNLFTVQTLFESLELLYHIVTSKYITVFEFGAKYIKARDVALAFRHRIGDVMLTSSLFLESYAILRRFCSQLPDNEVEQRKIFYESLAQ